MSAWSDRELPERYRKLVTGRTAAIVSLLVLIVVNFRWYSGFTFKNLMGDDLWRWLTFTDPHVLGRIVAPTGDKYRPLLDLFQYPLFKLFSANWQAWLLFNTAFNCVIIVTLFLLVRRVTKGDSLIAFGATLVYITSRFAYYSVLQVWGNMEALGLLFTLLILHVAVSYWRRPRAGLGLAIAGLYFIVIFTDERYVVLLPFILLLFLLAEKPERISKWALMGIAVLPLALNIFLKKVVWRLQYLVGPGGAPIVWTPMQTLQFTKNALANMFWVSAGDPGQLGVTAAQVTVGRNFEFFSIAAIMIFSAIFAIIAITREDAEQRRAELKIAALWAVLFGSLLVSSAVAYHQEPRWFTSTFVVLMVYFSYLYAKVHFPWLVKYGVFVALVALIVSADLCYRAYLPNVYFYYSQQMADSAVQATYGTYGRAITDYSLYIDQNGGLDWVLADGSFLAPYVGDDYHKKVHMVGSFNDVPWSTIDRSRALFFRLDWPSRTVLNITQQELASHPSTSAAGK